MRIEEHAFGDEEDGGIESHPDYVVESWSVTNGLILQTWRVLDARDAHEVEAWADSHFPDQYTIYCELSFSVGDTRRLMWIRVGGFGPDMAHGPTEDYLSNPEKVRRVRDIMGPEYENDPSLAVRYTLEDPTDWSDERILAGAPMPRGWASRLVHRATVAVLGRRSRRRPH